jgi:hypothetical protein
VKWESSFNTNLEGHFSNSKGLANSLAGTTSYDALENLDTGTVSLNDVYVNLDGVTGAKLDNVGL